MFELLGIIFGGLFRLAPEVVGIFKQKRENAHELEMTKLQLEIDTARAEKQIDMVHAQGEVAAVQAEMALLHQAIIEQGRPTGIPKIDALNASVRPVLTYWWCIGLHTAHKVVVTVVALQEGVKLAVLADMLYTDFDRQVVGSMIGFWFVDRALRRMNRN